MSKSKTCITRSAIALADQRARDGYVAVVGLPAERDQVHVVARGGRSRLRDLDAPFAGDGGRVHEGHRLVDHARQRPLHDRERERPGVDLGDPSQVAALDRADRSVGEAGQQRAEPLCQRQGTAAPFGHLRTGRDVHRERNELAPKREAHHLRDGYPGLVLRFDGGGAEVRSRDDGVEAEQRALGGGLGREHVERRTSQMPRTRWPSRAPPRRRCRREQCSRCARPPWSVRVRARRSALRCRASAEDGSR